MNTATQMIIFATEDRKHWLAAARKKAAIEASNKALNTPVDYDPLLSGCHFHDAESSGSVQFVHISDPDGRIISTGSNKSQACWYARRVRFSAISAPGNYYPTLKNCSFGVELNNGIAYRTVTMGDATPENPNPVRVLSRGSDKESAAKLANLCLIREKAFSTLTPDEFSHLCVVITLEHKLGGSGKIKNLTKDAPWRLGTHLLASNSESLALHQAIMHEATTRNIAIHKRVQWCEEKLISILNTNTDLSENPSAIKHVELKGPMFVVIRTPESSPAHECIQTLWCAIFQPVQPIQTSDQAGNEEVGVPTLERQR